MRAARFHGPGDVRIEDVPEPGPPGPGEVRLKVATAGICGSDGLEFRAGPVLVHPLGTRHPVTGHEGPLTLGHEFSAYVDAVGDGVDDLRTGDLVACGAGMSCGRCGPCRAGRTNLCVEYATIGFHRDGGLAGYCTSPADICADAGRVGLTADAAALAQPMAIAVHAATRGRAGAGDTAVVIGAGGIGSFLTFALAARCERVIVGDVDAARLATAAALGADRTLDLSANSLSDALDAPPDVVFEVSGSAAGLEQAVAVAPRGGRVVAVGVQKAPPTVAMGRVTLDELELIGTVAHVCATDLPEALKLLAARPGGWDDVAPVALPLDELVPDGLEPMTTGTATRIKTLVDPWATERRPAVTATPALTP